MLWMERLALMFYIVINVILFGFLQILCSSGYCASQLEYQKVFLLGIGLTLPFWFIFRTIDYMFGGPLRREIRRGEDLLSRIHSAKSVGSGSTSR